MTAKGDLQRLYERKARRSRPLRERFMALVDITDGCWLWKGATLNSGYGAFHAFGRAVQAPRLSMFLHGGGPFDSRLQSLHRCDVRLCVNPAHLYWGTPKDNVQDMFARGRNPSRRRG